MTAPDLVAAAVAELTGAPALDPSTLTRAHAFETWWQDRAGDQPLSEVLLLAYLLDHPQWGPTTAKNVASALCSYYRTTANIELRGPTITSHLARRSRDGRAPLPVVPALRVQDAREVAASMEAREVACTDPYVQALRDALVVLRSTAGPEQSIHPATVNLARLRLDQSDGHTLRDATGRVLADLTPDGAEQWARHLHVLGDRTRLSRRAQTALHRSGIRPDTPVGALTDAQWVWLWRGIDPDMPRRLRDRAYVLVGLAHARRHAELRRLDFDDITPTTAGFHITYLDHKNRTTIARDLHHVTAPDTTCGVECGACALQDLLDWENHCMGRSTGPVFATRYGGTVRRMTRQNGRHRIREAASHIDDHPWGSTRSLRAGAATSAWEAGQTLEQIAREVTGHLDISQADLYIRRLGTPADTIQLDLTPPTRHTTP